MNISDIRAGLRTLVESEKATYAQIARESGVAAGTLPLLQLNIPLP
ncbi:TPA: hypothetical protein ACJIPC_001576 [Escherichia coli]